MHLPALMQPVQAPLSHVTPPALQTREMGGKACSGRSWLVGLPSLILVASPNATPCPLWHGVARTDVRRQEDGETKTENEAKGVEIGSARNFLNAVRHQPWMVLHELAHSYHDRVLGFDHPKVKEAYEAAKKSGKYEKVLIWTGHVGRHYAMTDHKEYFAESTEAFFGTNDIYPFVKAELKQHDPAMYALLAELWGAKERPDEGK